eukprot:11418624-Heterocapsa_arctica.AAC.1
MLFHSSETVRSCSMAACSLSSSHERAVSLAQCIVKAWRRHRPSSSEPAHLWTLPCPTSGV